jgi:processive 1,2-diacylglycerol beta-glucosyltransferase
VAAACEELKGPGSARLLDLFATASPALNAIVRGAYLTAINRTPRLWQRVYDWMDRSTLLPRAFRLLGRDLRILAREIARERPGAICSTYPVYAFLLERLRRQGRLGAPHFNIVTDSISINSLWWRAGCSGWFVPNAETAEVLGRSGVPAGKVCVSGFPVTLFFARNAGLYAPPDLSSGAPPRVLQIINSGARNAEDTARALLAQPAWEVTVAVGRDDRLRRRLERLAAGRRAPASVLGWTDAIPRLLMTHSVVVSKAGGATTQEAIAARCPMVVSQVVPGQEEGNYELLRRHGSGALAETPQAVVDALRAAFADRGAVARAWREALSPLARPNAAREIALHLFGAPADP